MLKEIHYMVDGETKHGYVVSFYLGVYIEPNTKQVMSVDYIIVSELPYHKYVHCIHVKYSDVVRMVYA